MIKALEAQALLATWMVGCDVFHGGEFGTVIAADLTSYAEPMVRVRFGERIATLKPTEVGAK